MEATLITTLLRELLYIPNILMIGMFIMGVQMFNRIKNIDDNFECRVKDATKKQYLMVLRLMIISDETPSKDKMKHYDEYKSLGGNSWIDHYVETVVKPRLKGETPHRRETDGQEI